MEKYVQIYELSEATDDETVCAYYPNPSKNVSGKKNKEYIKIAEKEAREGECKLLVWRTVPNNQKCYTLTQNEVEQIVTFSLIEKGYSKQDCHALADRLGLKRPLMYDLGYQNNNCIGCVKGGMGYWNKIRKDFPEVFESRAKLEREIGHSCINGVFLDELDPDRGRIEDEISTDCGIMCYLSLNDIGLS